MSDTPVTVATPDLPAVRDESTGQFLPGQSGNPKGRPPGRRAQIDVLKQDLEIAVRKGLRADRVVKIIEKMADLAEEGNVRAAKLILSLAVSPAGAHGEAGDNQGGITIRIENATFAATAAKNEKPIEGRVIEVKENGD